MNVQRIKDLPTRMAINLQAKKLSLKSKQKGASALEYIVLAAVLVGVLTLALTNPTTKALIEGAFTDLFTDATTAGDGS